MTFVSIFIDSVKFCIVSLAFCNINSALVYFRVECTYGKPSYLPLVGRMNYS